jgi:hypothetical protein
MIHLVRALPTLEAHPRTAAQAISTHSLRVGRLRWLGSCGFMRARVSHHPTATVGRCRGRRSATGWSASLSLFPDDFSKLWEVLEEQAYVDDVQALMMRGSASQQEAWRDFPKAARRVCEELRIKSPASREGEGERSLRQARACPSRCCGCTPQPGCPSVPAEGLGREHAPAVMPTSSARCCASTSRPRSQPSASKTSA